MGFSQLARSAKCSHDEPQPADGEYDACGPRTSEAPAPVVLTPREVPKGVNLRFGSDAKARLDAIMAKSTEPIVFMKVDVEGSEVSVFSGARQTIEHPFLANCNLPSICAKCRGRDGTKRPHARTVWAR